MWRAGCILPGSLGTTTNDVPVPTMSHCRWALDQLARRWTEGWRDQKDKRDLRLIKEAPKTGSAPIKRKDTITEPFARVIMQLRPDLDADGIRKATDTFYALRARMEFRIAKVKKNLR
jgi:hypothetical protein